MIRNFLLASAVALALTSCNDTADDRETVPAGDSLPSTGAAPKPDVPATNMFAVLISYQPGDKWQIAAKIGDQSEQLENWYQAGLVENVYYKQSVQVQGHDSLPVVSFFIRAADAAGARSILDSAVMVQAGYATYELRAVGQPAMGRTAAAEEQALKKQHVFVVVYDFDNGWKAVPEAVIRQQAQRDSLLNVQGIMENAYVDYRDKSDKHYAAVYFINAADRQEVRTLISRMPVVAGGYAGVIIREAGSFMKGRAG